MGARGQAATASRVLSTQCYNFQRQFSAKAVAYNKCVRLSLLSRLRAKQGVFPMEKELVPGEKTGICLVEASLHEESKSMQGSRLHNLI